MARLSKDLTVAAAVFLVLAVTSAAFRPSLKNGFVNWDDPQYVVENPGIRSLSAAAVGKIFSSFSVANYQPLTLLSYALDYRLSGDDPNGYHATNLGLHLFNGLLVFWLVLLIGGRVWVACLTALLFGVHPLHVESVAWVSARKDVLYGFFFLAALVSYVHYLRRPQARRYYYGSLVLFLFSLLSKATAVTLPLVLLLLDRYPGRTDRKLALADKIPFFVLALVFGGLGFFAQHAAGAVRRPELFNLVDKLLIVPFALAFYLFKTVWPVGLSCLYPYFAFPGNPIFFASLIALFVAGLGGAVFAWGRSSRVVAFSSLFFLLTLLPVLQIVPLGRIIVADRYAYLPLLGLFYGFSEGMAWLYARDLRQGGRVVRVFLIVLAAGCVVGLGAMTARRCTVWRDSGTLWRDALLRHPASSIACNNLGVFYAHSGRQEEAARMFRRALAIDPAYAGPRNNLLLLEGR